VDRHMLQVVMYLALLYLLQPTGLKQSKDQLCANVFAFSLKSLDVSVLL